MAGRHTTPVRSRPPTGVSDERSHGAEEVSAVRSAIEQQALEVFSRKGYHAASIRDIVEAAGVTAPTLYYHFGSKEGLYRHLIRQLTERLRQRVATARSSGGGIRAQLVAITRGHIESMQQRRAEMRFLHRAILSQVLQGSFHGDVLNHRDMPAGSLLRLFQEAIDRKELAPTRPELLLNGYIGALNMYTVRRILVTCEGEGKLELGLGQGPEVGGAELETSMDDAERIVDLFLNGAAWRTEARR